MTFKEYVLSEGCFKTLNSDFFVRVGYQNYKRIVEEKFELIDFYDLNSIFKELEDDFCTFGFQELKITLKEFKKASEETFRRDIIQKSLKQLSSVRTDVRKYPFIFEDDIDSFNELVKKMIDEINDNSKSDFPNKPALGLRNICRDCDYLNICINNKFWTGVEIEDY